MRFLGGFGGCAEGGGGAWIAVELGRVISWSLPRTAGSRWRGGRVDNVVDGLDSGFEFSLLLLLLLVFVVGLNRSANFEYMLIDFRNSPRLTYKPSTWFKTRLFLCFSGYNTESMRFGRSCRCCNAEPNASYFMLSQLPESQSFRY